MTRGKGDHLTESDIARLQAAFAAGRASTDVASELGWSRRTVSRYFAMFRGTPQKLGSPKYRRPVSTSRTPPPDKSSRFYTSNFEL